MYDVPVTFATAPQPRWIERKMTLLSIAGLAAGAAFGGLLSASGAGRTSPVLPALQVCGTLWMNALRMVALPLALANVVCSMANTGTARAAGRIAGAIALYLVMLLFGAAVVWTVVPPIVHRASIDRDALLQMKAPASPESADGAKENGKSAGTPGDFVTALVPRNLARSAVNEEFLPLVIFAILFGLAMQRIDPENRSALTRMAAGLSQTLMVLVRWILWFAPVAMFALVATYTAATGSRLFGILGWFVLLECALMLAYLLLLYPVTVLAGGISLRTFAKAASGPQMVALSTRSSLAALPALLDAGDRMTPNPETSRVLLPMAVNMFKVNRTTSALCRALVILYFWSVPASAAQIGAFLFTVILLSFSDLGLPGGTHYRTLPAYLALGCPIDAVILLETLEPLSDICKTVLNVTGDLSIAAIVTRWSGRSVREPAPLAREVVAS